MTVRWLAAACLVGALAAGCGKKGPPLPPLVRLPVAPADLSAERRGGIVDLEVHRTRVEHRRVAPW